MSKPFSGIPASSQANMRFAVYEGMCFAILVGTAENYFSAYGVFLNATALQLGMLTALPSLVSAICHLASVWLLDRFRSRRTILCMFSALQTLSLVPMMLIPFLWGSGSAAANMLIVFVMLYFGFFAITTPVWNSLLGDLIPAEVRGRFLGMRNQRMCFCQLTAMLVGGKLLQYYADHPAPQTDFFASFSVVPSGVFGFFLVLALGVLARTGSTFFLSRFENPPYTADRKMYFSFLRFVSRTRYSNFAKFAFFAALIMAGASFSAPFFAPYMLRELQLSYFSYSVLISTPFVSQMFFYPSWGRLTDQLGAKRVLTIASIGVALNPLLWIVSTNFAWLLFLQFFAGAMWAGFLLSSATFFFDAVTPAKRAYCAAYRGLIEGVFVLIACFAGAMLADRLPALTCLDGSHTSAYLPIFLISGLLRALTCAGLLWTFEDGKLVHARHMDSQRNLVQEVKSSVLDSGDHPTIRI